MFDEHAGAVGDVPRGGPPYDVMVAVSAHDVAREIRRRLPGVGDVKLQKLLYYCQGHHLAVLDEPMFRERISAFDLGPVVGELWYAERNHLPEPPPAALSESALNTVGYVLSRYGGLSGPELVTLTHDETPWIEADAERRRRGTRSEPIPGTSVLHHFRSSRDEDEPAFDDAAVRAWLHDVAAEPARERAATDDAPELERRLRNVNARRERPAP